MTLSWFRVRARCLSAVALLSLAALTFGSAAPHADDCHEAECGVAAAHDPSSHRVGREQASHDQSIHCVVCHWTRAFRPFVAAAHALAPTDAGEAHRPIIVFTLLQRYSAAQPPLRAPPAPPVIA